MNNLDYQNIEDFILDDTFQEYVLGTSESSVAYWQNWISIHPENEKELNRARQILLTLLKNKKISVPYNKYDALDDLMDAIREEERNTSVFHLIPSWLKIAAVILLTIGFSWLWNQTYDFLIRDSAIAYNEVVVPIGEKSQVLLSDGSHVWINSGSKFKYPVSFGKESREVYLSGEAFFDVKHDDKQVFVVNTHDSRIKVLGTAFNVKSYPEDIKTQTTVVRGLVSVLDLRDNTHETLIRPNQMAEIRKKPEEDSHLVNKQVPALTVINRINVENVTSWKNQLLVFEDEPLGDMVLKMERWFNVKIEVQDSSLIPERYNGKFVHNETIYEVLEAIKKTTPIKYTVENNTIYIGRNKMRK